MHSKFITKLEEDLKPVLAGIEKRGLRIDVQKLQEIISGLVKERTLAESRAYELLGVSKRINLNSSKDLVELLTELKIEGFRLPKTKRGTFSTAKDILKGIKHPSIPHIIKYRSTTKLISTLESYYNAVDLFKPRLYFTFTNDCASGRLYTKDVSVQNLPHEGRFAILPEEGKVFISADYDMFELKILSALSGDKYFRKCWDNGIDLHKKVVSDMKGIPYENVDDSLRKLGKILNFGLAYGQEPPGIAQKLGIILSEAQKLVEDYLKNIPEIVRFKEECVRRAYERGYVETFFGRQRELADLKSSRYSDQLKAQRQAVNTPIQGTGADIAKIAMVRLYQAGWEISAMIHDSFLIEVPCDAIEESITQIRQIMEMDLNGLKLTASFKVGTSWGGCK